MNERVLVLVPTFNERENIEALVTELFRLPLPKLEVLVIDDNSPDKTADLAQELISKFPGLMLIRRKGPAGRGFAGRDGFLFALQSGADFTIEMDADFSHQPKHIPDLLRVMQDCDIAIGSRLVSDGRDRDRPIWRRWITRIANLYARGLLGLPVADTNSGFRCFNRKALKAIEPATLQSRGPSVLHETLFRAVGAGLRIREVPIEFLDRKKGASKLSLARLLVGYFWILRLRFDRK